MANTGNKKRDMIDDLIDIQADWQKVSNPLAGIADTLAQDPSQVRVFNPGDYKSRPRTNAVFCLQLTTKEPSVCTKCIDVCPVDAITIKDNAVEIKENCRKCALCVSVCPTEVFSVDKIATKGLYDRIARIAGAYEECYITCTRALRRLPKDNEVCLPCVGAISPELWFSLLAEYNNISVYLPVGICDRCQTTTGEDTYVNAIGTAEELSGVAVGLVADAQELNHEQTRAYKRSQFVGQMARVGQQALAVTNPALAGAQAIAAKLQKHSSQLYELQRQLERATGERSVENKRRILTQNRRLTLAALQKHPNLAQGFDLPIPVCNQTLCTACGDCVRACPEHACSLDKRGRFTVEPAYCVNCGACAAICPEKALTMKPGDPAQMVIVDPNEQRKKQEAARQKEQMKKAAEASKKQLKRGLDALEKLADS